MSTFLDVPRCLHVRFWEREEQLRTMHGLDVSPHQFAYIQTFAALMLGLNQAFTLNHRLLTHSH